MTVYPLPGYDFKHVEWGAKVRLCLCALEVTRCGLVVRASGCEQEVWCFDCT